MRQEAIATAPSEAPQPEEVAIVATNSTWDILMPGPTLGPPDQGMNVPFAGVISWPESSSSHLLGRKSDRSAPQMVGSK
ncbi:hypothetical protein MAP00_003847 [Monascus purpureus]|nr:hypothetical protein MAP00_003847 [Monascus purpureus]